MIQAKTLSQDEEDARPIWSADMGTVNLAERMLLRSDL
jgi:hypothetical protein